MNPLSRFVWDDRGQHFIEHAMMLAFITGAAVLAISFMGGRFGGILDSLAVAVGSIGAGS